VARVQIYYRKPAIAWGDIVSSTITTVASEQISRGLAPMYMQDRCRLASELSSGRRLRSANVPTFVVPRTRTKLGVRCSRTKTNSLPGCLRQSETQHSRDNEDIFVFWFCFLLLSGSFLSSIYRVGQLKWGHLTFLLVLECVDKIQWFLADRTNGRAIGAVLRLSVCRLWRYVLWLNGAS